MNLPLSMKFVPCPPKRDSALSASCSGSISGSTPKQTYPGSRDPLNGTVAPDFASLR